MGKFVAYKGQGEEPFRFRLEAEGDHSLRSEGYVAADGRDNGIRSVRENAPQDERYDRRVSDDKKHYFVLKAGNGEIIGTSKLYESEADREQGIAAIKKEANDASVVEETK